MAKSMHAFFLEQPGKKGEIAALNPHERDHLFRTLRARPGERILLLDGRGCRMTGMVCAGNRVELLEVEFVPEPARKLHLFCAVPRRARFDLLLKQAAELGVWSIRLLSCTRSVAKPEGSERWKLLLQEGCKQSGNPFLPRIASPVPLAVALEELRCDGASGFFGVVRSAESAAAVGGDLAWFVGPEGGFTDEEESEMREFGVRALNLGPYVLRLETAAVCGLAVLRQWMGQS